MIHSGRLQLYSQTRLERLAKDEHTRLLRTLINFGHKKFYSIGPMRHVQNFFKDFYQNFIYLQFCKKMIDNQCIFMPDRTIS